MEAAGHVAAAGGISNKYMFYRYPCPFIRSVVHNGYHIDYRRRRQDDLARMANEY